MPSRDEDRPAAKDSRTRVDVLLSEFIDRAEAGLEPSETSFVGRLSDEGARKRLAVLIQEYRKLGDLLPDPSDPIGTLGSYKVGKEIARGGMGIVYAAVDSDGNDVAIKMLPKGVYLEETTISRFEREREILKNLDHPAVVNVIEIGEDGGRQFFVMDRLDGGSLEERIRLRRAEPPAPSDEEVILAVTVMARIARATAAANEHGVVHRDIKPSNILFDDQGRPYLADFGLAHIQGASHLTSTTKLLGTAAYIAPERVLRPEIASGPGVDVFSLGVTLFEAITLQRPFQGTLTDIIAAVRSGPPQVSIFLGRSLGRDLDSILEKSLADLPWLRYPTAAALAEDLEAWLANAPILANRGRRMRRVVRTLRRRPGVSVGVLISLLILLFATFFWARTRARLKQAAQDRIAELNKGAEDALATHKDRLDSLDRLLHESARTGLHSWPLLGASAERIVDWDGEYAALRASAEVAHDFVDRELRKVLTEDPNNETAKELHQEFHLRVAQRLQRLGFWREAELEWTTCDDFPWIKEPERGRLTVKVSPPHSLVHVNRYDLADLPWSEIQVEEPEGGLTSPIDLPRLDPGSYVVLLRRPEGKRWIRVPVLIQRGETSEIEVNLPEDDLLCDDWVYIADGAFLAGSDMRAPASEPLVRRDVGDYFMKVHEVTCGEYVEFVQDVSRSGACPFGSKEKHDPHDHIPQDSKGKRFAVAENGEVFLTEDDYFRHDIAIHQIDWRDADHYVQWLNRRGVTRDEPWIYSLPTSDQWEKAARGVDGRAFTWGDQFKWNFAATWISRNEQYHLEPGRWKTDTSPFGVMDMVGNIREFCLEHDPKSNRHLIRGGEESFYTEPEYRLSARWGGIKREVNWDFGIRLVRTLKK